MSCATLARLGNNPAPENSVLTHAARNYHGGNVLLVHDLILWLHATVAGVDSQRLGHHFLLLPYLRREGGLCVFSTQRQPEAGEAELGKPRTSRSCAGAHTALSSIALGLGMGAIPGSDPGAPIAPGPADGICSQCTDAW